MSHSRRFQIRKVRRKPCAAEQDHPGDRQRNQRRPQPHPQVVLIAIAFWLFVREPERGSADTVRATHERASFRGLFANPAFWTATLGMAMWTFAVGGISTWLPTFFHRFAGYSVGGAGLTVGEITAVDGLLATVVGGWIAQKWLKRNHRALYLVSAWSAVLAIPFGVMVFFGPLRFLVPAAWLAEFCIFLNTGPLNAAIVNSASATARSSTSGSKTTSASVNSSQGVVACRAARAIA